MAKVKGPPLSQHRVLYREWHLEANAERWPSVAPEDVRLHWKRKAVWRCSNNPDHVWAASISARARGEGGCEFCWEAKHSNKAAEIARLLRAPFHFDPDCHKIPKAEGIGAHDVDILIPSPFGGKSLVIEFDSHYYHKCEFDNCRHLTACRHRRDREKSLALKRLGYVVVRIRELPLDAGCSGKRHHRRDLYVRQRASAAQIVEELAPHIRRVFGR